MGAIQNAPEAFAKPLLDVALADFQTIYDNQEAYLDKLGTHPHGELRMGLAEVLLRKGEMEKSKEQLEAIVKALPDTRYSKRAQEWLAAKPDANLKHSCIGCHTAKKD